MKGIIQQNKKKKTDGRQWPESWPCQYIISVIVSDPDGKRFRNTDFVVGLYISFEAGVQYATQRCWTGPAQKPDGKDEEAQAHQAQYCHSSNKSTCHGVQW